MRQQRCQRCAARHQPRWYGKPAGTTTQFRSALSHLLKTRLNPRATPFVFPSSVRRNRWQYVTDPVTKHLCLPTSYKAFPSKKTKRTRKNLHRYSKSVEKKPPTYTSPCKNLSRSLGPLSDLRAALTCLSPQTHNTSSRQRNAASKSKTVRSAVGRHRRHRRHRKNTLRGLPTPASSLYSRPRAPAPLPLHEGIAHDLEDHG